MLIKPLSPAYSPDNFTENINNKSSSAITSYNTFIIYLIVGENSGDLSASKIMERLKIRLPNVKFMGIGGPLMEKQGLNSLFPMAEIAIMGLLEVIPKIFKIKKLIQATVDNIKEIKPNLIITVDSLGFNKRVAIKVKKENLNIPLVHFIAPSVWAWKPKRAKVMAGIYDYLLCLFAMEIPYFEKEGLPTFFVGHPIIESGADKGEAKNFLDKYLPQDVNNLKNKNYLEKTDKKYLLLMPGSRTTEVSRLLPIFVQSVEAIKINFPNLKIILPTVPHLKNYLDNYISLNNLNYLVVTEQADKYDAFQLASLAIVASGTVTLELALAKVPTIVAYRVNPITSFIARFLIKIKYASIINIIANKEIIKEYIQRNCKVKNIADKAISMLKNPTQYQTDSSEILRILQEMGYENFSPSDKAARVIQNILLKK
ncbi:Lipid-A-disaccharide synthase [Candidatus Hepatincolaceae symbiont of Richtersius coronifer]